MSTYCSLPIPTPDGALFIDVAYDCFGTVSYTHLTLPTKA